MLRTGLEPGPTYRQLWASSTIARYYATESPAEVEPVTESMIGRG